MTAQVHVISEKAELKTFGTIELAAMLTLLVLLPLPPLPTEVAPRKIKLMFNK